MSTIYDCGANNGDDIPYYLLRADKVVAIEANPNLAEGIRLRFSECINVGRLFVEECVVTGGYCGSTEFYINDTYDYLGTTNIPVHQDSGNYRKVKLKSRSITSIIEQYGEPYYIKIDIEGGDDEVLTSILKSGYRPPYLSVEAHSFDVFTTLVCLGNYKAFKLLDGLSVVDDYSDFRVTFQDGKSVPHAFPLHSAGPFGNDIAGDWMSTREFFKYLSFVGTGWKDIHVSSIDSPMCINGYEQLYDIAGVTSRWIFRVAIRRIAKLIRTKVFKLRL